MKPIRDSKVLLETLSRHAGPCTPRRSDDASTRRPSHRRRCPYEHPSQSSKSRPWGSASAGVGSPSSRHRSMKCSCEAERSLSSAARHLAMNVPGVTTMLPTRDGRAARDRAARRASERACPRAGCGAHRQGCPARSGAVVSVEQVGELLVLYLFAPAGTSDDDCAFGHGLSLIYGFCW